MRFFKSVKAGEKASVSKDMVKCWNHFDEENSAFGTENEIQLQEILWNISNRLT